MIGIISETRYEKETLENLRKQGCVVNYTLIPQFYNEYNAELNKINNLLIAKSTALIFRIETFYAGTKEALERALFFKKKCKVLYKDKTYILNTLDDWKCTTGYGSHTETKKHPLLQIYEEQRSEFYDKQALQKAKQRYERATEGVNISEEEVYRLVNAYKVLYDIDVDMDDKAAVYLAYQSIQYYLNNDIEYSNEPQGEDFPYEIISFGDATYMEDYIYQNKVTKCR